jgi:hypothetical protein
MTEESNALTDLFAACWKDDVLKARFMSDPRPVLAELGLSVPEDVEVRVVENTDKLVHITLPKAPGNHASLSDAELGEAAAGVCVVVNPGGARVSN